VSNPIITSWRGSTFPKTALSEQPFFLDVPNDNDPPRGWYVFRTSIGTPNAAGKWILTDRAVGDRGDLVRPSRERRH
jgi:hypothetical protein